MKYIVFSIALISTFYAGAQGVRLAESPGSPDTSAGLEVDFTNRGFLPPRLTTGERDAIVSPAEGLMIFNTTIGCPQYYYASQWFSQCGTPPVPPFTCGDEVEDASGNSYSTVQIGTQCWFQQALNTAKYNNGDDIPNVTGGGSWAAQSAGAWCHYDNNTSYGLTYGRLYNYYAVADSRGLCPEGWHIPTEAEWIDLEVHLGMPGGELNNIGFRGTSQGGMLKQAGTSLWWSPNNSATNSTGFTSLPTGGRASGSGSFYFVGQGGDMWSSTMADGTTAWYRSTYYDSGGIWRGNADRTYGFSVRCLKD